MIVWHGKSASQFHWQGKNIIFIYAFLELVWGQVVEIFSCFGKGYWIDEYPWIDEDVWSN